jgi:hypothetical protein
VNLSSDKVLVIVDKLLEQRRNVKGEWLDAANLLKRFTGLSQGDCDDFMVTVVRSLYSISGSNAYDVGRVFTDMLDDKFNIKSEGWNVPVRSTDNGTTGIHVPPSTPPEDAYGLGAMNGLLMRMAIAQEETNQLLKDLIDSLND